MKVRKEKFITGGGGEEAVRQKRNTKRGVIASRGNSEGVRSFLYSNVSVTA